MFHIRYCTLLIISLRNTGLYCPGNEMIIIFTNNFVTVVSVCICWKINLGRIFHSEHGVIARNSVSHSMIDIFPFYANCRTASLCITLKTTVMAGVCHLASACDSLWCNLTIIHDTTHGNFNLTLPAFKGIPVYLFYLTLSISLKYTQGADSDSDRCIAATL